MADDPTQLDPTEVHQRLASGDAVLVDVRDASAYAEAHAAGATSIPIDQLADRLDELPAGTQVVTTCGGGTRGPRAAKLLAEHGVDAAVLRGGLRAWRAADLPTE